MELFAKHEETLKRALTAVKTREYWSVFPESPRAYPAEAPQTGEQAFQDRLGRPFAMDHPGTGYASGDESSPYGVELGIAYPRVDAKTLLTEAAEAQRSWAQAGVEDRTGVCLEILERLSARSFEMAYAVMYTTGQPFLMAFQTGGPLALDRALETVAHAYRAMREVPSGETRWVKSQGRSDPLEVDKQWRIRPRGIALSITGTTSPTWGGYPGIMASLATGNAVVIKPHQATILPLAIVVETAREVLAEAGFDPNTVLLSVDEAGETLIPALATDPRVRIVDYDGEPALGTWLEEHVTGAQLYLQRGSVNSVIIDSAEDMKGVFRNLSASLTMYSGQMRTTPQNIYVPRDGVTVGEIVMPAADVAAGLASAIAGLLADDQRASDILGAIKDPAVSTRIDAAAETGQVLLESRSITPTSFPNAHVRTPIVVEVAATDRAAYMREMFGPVVYVIITDGTSESLHLAGQSAAELGSSTWLVYTTDENVKEAAIEAAVTAGVPIAFNLVGGLYVNQIAPFSDYSGSGGNPANSPSLIDSAFVSGRFSVVGIRSSS